MLLWLLFSVAKSCPTLFNSRDCSTRGFLSFTTSQNLLKPVHWVGDAIQPQYPLLPLLLPPSILLSIRVIFNELALEVLELQHQSFQRISGLISFRVEWWDLLAVQRTLKSLLQHHSSKASILQHSAFFMVQPSHPYMTTGKTIALTI